MGSHFGLIKVQKVSLQGGANKNIVKRGWGRCGEVQKLQTVCGIHTCQEENQGTKKHCKNWRFGNTHPPKIKKIRKTIVKQGIFLFP